MWSRFFVAKLSNHRRRTINVTSPSTGSGRTEDLFRGSLKIIYAAVIMIKGQLKIEPCGCHLHDQGTIKDPIVQWPSLLSGDGQKSSSRVE
jgi:hypothetical protein